MAKSITFKRKGKPSTLSGPFIKTFDHTHTSTKFKNIVVKASSNITRAQNMNSLHTCIFNESQANSDDMPLF
jgi:hypothetical protein